MTRTPTATPSFTSTPLPVDLTISAVADRNPVGTGELLSYTLSFSNRAGIAGNATVEAMTPAGTTFESASPAAETFPAAGGAGLVRWSVGNLTQGGGGVVILTVRADDSLSAGTQIILDDYAITSSIPPTSVAGPSVLVTVEEDLDLKLLKTDDPDGVVPGGVLTYTVTVSNTGQAAQSNIIVRELYDANFLVGSATPPADAGTTDRWTIPFLPVGAAQTITIVGQVRDTAIPGTLLRNLATAQGAGGLLVQVVEETRVVATQVLGLSIDDVPDPVAPGEELVYAITVVNQGDTQLSGVVVQASTHPALGLNFASPPTIPGGNLAWTVGTLPVGGASRIFVSFNVDDALVSGGEPLWFRSSVADASGQSTSATELTSFNDGEMGPPLVLTLSGAPRNLRLGVVTTMIYKIGLRNIGAVPATGVVINSVLPTGLDYAEAQPPPTSRSGQLLTYEFSTLAPGASKLIVVKADLGADAMPGMSLTNTITASDAAGHFDQATHTGTVLSSGSDPSAGKLAVKLVTVKRVVAGSKLQSTINVTNGGRGDTENVVVTLLGPPVGVTLLADQTIPPPTSQQMINGQPSWTWTFARMKGPGNLSIKTKHSVANALPNGSVLTFTAGVSAGDGRADSATKSIEVRN